MQTREGTPGVAEASVARVPARSPGDPLGVLVEHVRNHPRVHAAGLVLVDPERHSIEPAAAWFASPVAEQAARPAMTRPYDRELPGIVEVTLERGRPLFLPRLEDWEAAPLLEQQFREREGQEAFARSREIFARSSVIACPVRTALGRTLGVLCVASLDPGRPLLREDLLTVEALSDLAAFALERKEQLAEQADRSRDEVLLKRAAEDAAGSLESADVPRGLVRHALELVRADSAVLSAEDGGRMGPVARAGLSPVDPEPALVAQVARSHTPIWRDSPPALHVPVGLGPRLFGVLSVTRLAGAPFSDRDTEVIGRLTRSSAAAIANAIDFDRERRIARALTRGFVPESLPPVAGYEIGLLYEPAASQPTGGDLYGTWQLPTGELAVLVGDVAGKGVETAALSAMTRFFIEARSWDSDSPALTLAQTNTMLRSRLPEDTFVTAFLAQISGGVVRWASAGHLPPILLRADRRLASVPARGVPLGIDELPEFEEAELELRRGDLLLAYTDGLVEARAGGELFGVERLERALAEIAAPDVGAEDVVRRLHERVRSWTGSLSDDTVALALRRR